MKDQRTPDVQPTDGASQPPKKKKKNVYMRLHFLLAGLIRLALRVHVTGKENIPKEGGMVVCANHTCYPDPVMIAAAFSRQIVFLAKKELFRIPVFRSLIRGLGAYPLDRRGDIGAVKTAVSLAKGEGDREGVPVLIFPQGTRHRGRSPAGTPVKSGAAAIAFHAGVPMLPVCIRMKKQKYCLFRRMDIIIGKPMYAEELGFSEGGSAEFTAATKKVFHEVCVLGGYAEEESAQ